MRRENELNVQNVATRREKAREWARPDNRVDDERPPEKWYHRLFRWETITLPNKTVEKGFVITPTIATVLLAAFLGVLGYGYKSSTADSRETRESIIRMETMLNERTQVFKEQQAEMKLKLDDEVKLASMYRENESRKRMELMYALRQRGIKIN